jgi:serine/threonine protein kinase
MSCSVRGLQVFEFMDSDLEALIKAKGVVLSPADVKCYMSMLLRALQDCHRHWILHRDIKPNNMLLSRTGECCGRAGTADSMMRHLHVNPDCTALVAANVAELLPGWGCKGPAWPRALHIGSLLQPQGGI